MVINTSEGGVFYAPGNSSTLTQLAALPNHTHSGYATQNWVGDNYLSKSGGKIIGKGDYAWVQLRLSGNIATIMFEQNEVEKGCVGWMGNTGIRLQNSNEYGLAVKDSNEPIYYWGENGSVQRTLLHSGNYADYALPKTGGTLTSSGVTTLNLIDTARNEAAVSYAGNGGYIWYVGKGVGGIGEKFGFYNNSKSLVANLDINGNFTATKFIGPLQGNADTATRLLSPYAYENNATISTTTTPETLFPHSYTFSAMMESDASLFGTREYANVLNFSGYQKYGATQFAVKYNTGAAAAIRAYVQGTGWSPWKLLAFKDDLTSYLPLSGGSLSGYLSSSDYILGTGLIRVNASDKNSNFGYIKAETYDSNRSVVHIGSNYGGSSNISNTVSYDAIGIYRTCVGIGGTFAGSTLKSNYDAGIKLDVAGNVKATKFIGDVSGNATSATTATSANALGSYTIGNFMTFANYDQYVAAGFEDSNLSQKAVDTYIEFLDSPGWFNSKWGTVTANGGFIGNLTGTATNSNGLGGYTWEAKQNSVDTWVPVFTGNKLQYRAIPTAYNGAPSTLSVGSAVITNYIKNLNNVNGTSKPYDYNSDSLSIHSIYNGTSTGFPFGYGNLLTIRGTGTTQLALEWNSAQTDTNPNVSQRIAIRSQRDSAGNNWSKWTEVLTDGNYTSYCSSIGHTHSYLPLAGGTLTGNIIKFANGTELYNESTTSFAINKNSSTRWITINDSGVRASNFITDSDKRLKTNIKPLPTNSKSLELNFYEFDYVNNDNHSAGHIAQEVKEVYPELVHGNEAETEHLSIDYNGLHSIQIHDLIDYIKCLEKRIIELENKL